MARTRRRNHERQSTAEPSVPVNTGTAAPEAVASAEAPVAAPRRRRRVVRLVMLVVVLGGLFALKHVWWPPAFRGLAVEELRQGHVEDGLAWLEYVDWLVPEDVTTTLLRARAYRKLGHMPMVSKLLAEAREEGATTDQIRREQILALAQSGQMRQAHQYLDEFLQDREEDLDDVCEAYVIGYIRNLRLAEATAIVDAWTKDSPDLATPLLLRGRIWFLQGDHDKAEADLRDALAIDPELDLARMDLSEILWEELRYDEAIPLLEDCLDSPGVRVQALVKLALCLKATGDSARALTLLQQAVSEDPDDRSALLELGQIEFENADYESATETLMSAMKIFPNDRELRYVLAQSLRLGGREEEAREHFEFVDRAQKALEEMNQLDQQIRRNPGDVEAIVAAGKLFLEYSNAEEGVLRLLSALDLDPENQEARQLLVDHYERRAKIDPVYQALADEHRRHLR
jgi:tetratricopeptide (TPR) repeat protein